MAKVTGIGGVFFKSKGDPKALAAWYQKHLGMPPAPWHFFATLFLAISLSADREARKWMARK